MSEPVFERYECITAKRIERLVQYEPNSGCWLWCGMLDDGGYGRISIKTPTGRAFRRAHRASYQLFKALIPRHLVLDHLCRTRCCVNPDHLEVVTNFENLRRGIWNPKTHCPKGHEYTEANTVMRSSRGVAYRACRVCLTQSRQRYNQKRAKNTKRNWPQILAKAATEGLSLAAVARSLGAPYSLAWRASRKHGIALGRERAPRPRRATP